MSKTEQDKTVSKSGETSLKDIILKVRDWWRYLLSRWAIILICGSIGAALGLTYSLFKKTFYTAELSFALEDDKSGSGGLGAAMGLASQFGIDLGGSSVSGAFSGDNLLGLMKSRSMVESTLLKPIDISGKKQTLAELYISFNKLRENWVDMPRLRNIQFSPGVDRKTFSLQQDSVLGDFYKRIVTANLSVDKIDKKLSIITVVVTSENELFSKYFAEMLTKTVSGFYIDTKTRKSVQNVEILQHQTDSVRQQLNAAITGVAMSGDNNPNANPSLQILRVPSQRRQVDVQANQAILTQLVANLEISKVSLRKETPLIQVIDSPILPLEKKRFGKTKGLVLGGILAGFLASLFVLSKKMFQDLLN